MESMAKSVLQSIYYIAEKVVIYLLIKISIQQFCQTSEVIVAEIACGCVSIFHQSLVEFGHVSSLDVVNINQH